MGIAGKVKSGVMKERDELIVLNRYDFRNKNICVIGGGSSSIQIVPKLQQVEGAKLNVVVRSQIWITNRFGDKTMNDLGLDPSQLSCKFVG